MRSTFFGLDIAAKGLFVSQRQLDVMGHNVANANTEGYSRQRYILSNVPPPGILGQFALISKGAVGHGVETLSLDQIRDRFLDRQYRQEAAKASYWDSRASALYYVEDVFNGTPETRLDGIMAAFFNSVQELSKNPTDQAVRTTVAKSSEQLTMVMHEYFGQLKDLMYNQDLMIVEQSKIINQYSQQIAALNDTILRFEQGGQVANDLRDHRNLLLDKLSALADISYREIPTGKYGINGNELATLVVYIGPYSQYNTDENQLLIDHKHFIKLETEDEYGHPLDDVYNYVTDTYGDILDLPPLHSLRFGEVIYDFNGKEVDDYKLSVPGEDFAEFNSEVILTTGEIRAYLDMRDGDGIGEDSLFGGSSVWSEGIGIPYYIRQLDLLAKALVTEFNSIHREGWTMPVGDESSANDIPFFFDDDADGFLAGCIRLSDDIKASVFNIAASDVTVEKNPSGDPEDSGHFYTGNNAIALRLLSMLKDSNSISSSEDQYNIGSFEGFFKNFISELAAEVNNANQMYQSEAVLADSIHAQRLSVMNVSLDEEMTDMIRFQHAYNAAARTITTMDEMLDVMINRMGRVGL